MTDDPAYRLVVPDGWTRLPVEPAAMRAAARALLLRRFAAHPRDATAVLRRELEEQLVGLTQGPGSAYLRMVLLLDLQVSRRPVAASCLVSLLPQEVDGERGLQELAERSAPGAVSSTVEDLGAGRGVVVVRDRRDGDAPVEVDPATAALAHRVADWLRTGDAEPPVRSDPVPAEALHAAGLRRTVEVLLPAPDAPRVLLLSFGTGVSALFEPLTALFLAVASTVQWQRDDTWA